MRRPFVYTSSVTRHLHLATPASGLDEVKRVGGERYVIQYYPISDDCATCERRGLCQRHEAGLELGCTASVAMRG